MAAKLEIIERKKARASVRDHAQSSLSLQFERSRLQCLSRVVRVVSGKNPFVAPTPAHEAGLQALPSHEHMCDGIYTAQVHKKAALESLLNLAPSKISADVLEHVKADLAALEKSIEKAP